MEPIAEDGKGFLKITGPRGGARRIDLGKADWITGFVGEIRNMCNCILSRAKPICDERVGAESTAIVSAAYLSQRGMRGVALDDFKEYALKVREREGGRAPEAPLKELLKGIRG